MVRPADLGLAYAKLLEEKELLKRKLDRVQEQLGALEEDLIKSLHKEGLSGVLTDGWELKLRRSVSVRVKNMKEFVQQLLAEGRTDLLSVSTSKLAALVRRKEAGQSVLDNIEIHEVEKITARRLPQGVSDAEVPKG